MKKSKIIDIVLLSPAVIFYIIFVVLPLLGGLYYSTTNWDGIKPTFDFIGFQNYITLFHDKSILIPLKNTIIFAIFTTVILNVGALLIAIALDRELKSKNFLRSCFFIPVLLSPLVVGYIYSFIFGESIARLGEILGIESVANNLLGSVDWSLYAAIFAASWRMVGWYMIIYLAGLQSIPKSLLEAAEVDGANAWQKFKQVTFPLLAPALTVNIILAASRAFKEFDMLFSLTGGGPGNSSELITLTIFRESFSNKRAGYGSAIGIILFLIIVSISLIQLVWLRRRENNVL